MQKLVMTLLVALLLSLAGCAAQKGATEASGPRPVGMTVDIKNASWKKYAIQNAALLIKSVEETEWVLALTRVQGGTAGMSSIDAKGKFVVIKYEITNMGADSIFKPAVFEGCLLIDEEGNGYDIDERALGFMYLFYPFVLPNETKGYQIFFDIPERARPASLKLQIVPASVPLNK